MILNDYKFRGESIENNQLVYGYYSNIQQKEHYILQPCALGYYHVQVKPETVSQFTGFKTSKGQEIYEGDLIRQKLEDSFEPSGFYWWKAKVQRHPNGAWVLMQLRFDYSKSPFEEYTLLIKECKNIELINS